MGRLFATVILCTIPMDDEVTFGRPMVEVSLKD